MREHIYFPLVLALIAVETSGVAQGLLRNNSILNSLQSITASTVPPSGDLNPYGVAFVPAGFPSGGAIAAGDVLVSNFNNSANAQGLGTTIIQLRPGGPLAPPGDAATFFTSGLPGLSTALGVLKAGFVIVGNVPTTNGNFDTIGQGALQVIDSHGH